MEQQTSIDLPRLYERDIDVLLQEELVFNPTLLQLIASELGLEQINVEQCRLSVVDDTGETDLFAHFSMADRRGVLLIENKVDAVFQPNQPERYRARAVAMAEQYNSIVRCLLIAPSNYVAGAKSEASHFDAVVSYESIAAAIEAEGTPRAKHRANLMLRAIEQARSSYIVVPAPEVTNLWQRIYKIADAEFPELRMKPPSDKGSSSSWIIFKGPLPKRVSIDWKIEKGLIDLSFWSSEVAPAVQVPLAGLPEGARWQAVGKKATAIRVPWNEPVREWASLDDGVIRSGLSLASQLLDFCLKNRLAVPAA